MSPPPDALVKLAELGVRKLSGVYLREKASESAIRRMLADAKRDLPCEVPARYVDFLRLTNGVQISGAYFEAAETLTLWNLDVPREHVIVLGSSGNHTEYIFDSRDKRFHNMLMGDEDGSTASYETFDELLFAVLETQQVI